MLASFLSTLTVKEQSRGNARGVVCLYMNTAGRWDTLAAFLSARRGGYEEIESEPFDTRLLVRLIVSHSGLTGC